uniref:Uncharacterized protein n=1 Tax=Cucumis melo TaxID=3656 RepID=A0A9I9E6U4_CUCME
MEDLFRRLQNLSANLSFNHSTIMNFLLQPQEARPASLLCHWDARVPQHHPTITRSQLDLRFPTRVVVNPHMLPLLQHEPPLSHLQTQTNIQLPPIVSATHIHSTIEVGDVKIKSSGTDFPSRIAQQQLDMLRQ